MGKVYRARDRMSGEAAAVKLLHGTSAEEGERFAREALALSELDHPGIVRYLAHGVHDAVVPYLAMEWLEGGDLSGRLKRGVLSVDEVWTLATRVAEAIAAAHARGIVHRDIKPSNLFVVGGDVARVKLLDFGVARLDGMTTMTTPGTVLGTPGYMAPEQARGVPHVGAAADVFALGAVLFACLTGRPAFRGEHLLAVLAKILFQELPPVRDLRADVPATLDALIGRMLAKDPEKRPRDGAAVVDALRAAEAQPVRERPHSCGARAGSALTGAERRAPRAFGDLAQRERAGRQAWPDAPDGGPLDAPGIAAKHRRGARR
ncbi:hypothetical protein BE21_31410 [Sorangium cellulosum]|uniref:Protein kinase domain-containing protein n=1 Tax=Sorangium cellulosum TaxID=56 RepID=A0A150TQZ6_SORCE|nr:hypothetical protein BE21_31410 [Sorangium cellulosum]